MRSSPETAIIKQPTAATKLPSTTSTTTKASDAIDAAVSTQQQPAATPATSSDAADVAVVPQQPAATPATSSDAADAAVASQHMCFHGRRNLRATLKFWILALLMASDGRKAGNLFDAAYNLYLMLCAHYHYAPCHKRTIERFVTHVTAKGNQGSKDPDKKRFLNNRLTQLAAKLVDALSSKARLGTLDEGVEHLEAFQKMRKENRLLADIFRILLLDGSHDRLEDNASEVSEQKDGAEPDAAKGLAGTCSRKLHLLLDQVSRAVIAYKITAGTASEIAVLKELIEAGYIRLGDLLIADAGYFSAEVIALLNAHGVFFVIKGKAKLNPEVLKYVRYSTHKTELPAEVAKSDEPEVSDWLTCEPKEVWTSNSEGAGTKTYKDLVCEPDEAIDAFVCMKGVTMRMVQIYNPTKDRDGKDESPYVYITTNLPANSLCPMGIWALSRSRWSVELSFKALKRYCYMSGWDTARVGRADFYILMALASFQLKVLHAQVVQAKSKKTISMLSACKTDGLDFWAFLGIPHLVYSKVDPVHRLNNAKERSKTKAKIKKQYERYTHADDGNAAVITDHLLRHAQKARVSLVNRLRLKSLGLLGKLMAYFPVPKVTLQDLP